ncbi:MAG: hypothetical protein DMF64_22370 [Acidobacteria bacterium]|nr:MAG: hypothetical protein DMF64_22370 [Acidobacteriota bacterium]
MGVTWSDGALAGATLFDALRNLGLDPGQQCYEAVGDIKRAQERGLTIVGMGRIVQRVLTREGIPHLQLRHPAARGRDRLRARYHTHARDVLTKQSRAAERSE